MAYTQRRWIRALAGIALQGLGFFLRWVPRSARLVAVGCYRNAFADNPKYLYIELIRTRRDLRVVWISGRRDVVAHVRAQGGEACLRWSLPGVWIALRARHWFVASYVSDVNVFFSHGAVVTNLWHGMPMKKIEFDIDGGPTGRLFHHPTWAERWALFPGVFRRADYLVSPSAAMSDRVLSRAFRIPAERCLAAAPARILPLVCDEATFREVLRWSDAPTRKAVAELAAYRTCHVYLPTWRDSRPNFLADLLPELGRLSDALEARGEAFVLKPHPNTPRDLLSEFRQARNVVVVDPAADVYPILRGATTLVTDYSSIVFDFLFLDRPILFFPFDLEQYLAEDRGLYFPYAEVTPGPQARTLAELVDLLAHPEDERWRADRRRLFAWAYGDVQPRTAGALVEALVGAPAAGRA